MFMLSLIFHRLIGSPVPPSHGVKAYWLDFFRRAYQVRTFVETGTYRGATVAALFDRFERVYTIELDRELWQHAQKRFARHPHVLVIQGNSGDVLLSVLAGVSDQCLFWLDGHFSGDETARGGEDTPIVAELNIIRSHQRNDHVILIDDARMFRGADGYPALDRLFTLLKEINSAYIVDVADDIIRARLPKQQ